ncbi:serpin family protein, partial [bacterium]|nr:serpin family protein [bacterium]
MRNMSTVVLSRVVLTVSISVFFLFFSACTFGQNINDPALGCNSFALDFFKAISAKDKGNLFFSPESIHSAMAMVFEGAGGETANQMGKVLHFSVAENGRLSQRFLNYLNELRTTTLSPEIADGVELTVANAIWAMDDFNFNGDYLDSIKKIFESEVNLVNFADSAAATEKINNWVADKTRQKIKDLIPQGLLSKAIKLILTNAIYFKGKWASQFSENATMEEPFFPNSSEKIQVKMMRQIKEFSYMETPDFQGLRLPYKGNGVSMLIFLPTNKEGLSEFEKNLSVENFENWLHLFKKHKVNLHFPKFKQESNFSLTSFFKELGLSAPFDSGLADFSGMVSDTKPLFISEILHKAFVAVDEEGTEAVAA